jgi:LysM repeat protein
LFLPGCFQSDHAKIIKQTDPVTSVYSLNQQRVNRILRTAFSQIGNPYRYGGNSPETGFDCSGFVGWVYKQYGLSLPRSARDMLAVGEPIDRSELRPGDLVFFNYGYSHVGIYTGDDKYIHSPRTGKRIEEVYLSGRGRGDRFVGARRVINNVGVTDISDRLKNEWIAQSRHQTDLILQAALAQKRPAVAKGPGIAQTASNSVRATGTRKSPTRTVPGTVAKNTAPQKTASKKATAGKTQGTYKVVPGDNLVTLAKRYGLSSNDIAAANNLQNKNKLKPGQKLIIPAKAKSKGKSTATAKSKGKDTKVAKNAATKKSSAKLKVTKKNTPSSKAKKAAAKKPAAKAKQTKSKS